MRNRWFVLFVATVALIIITIVAIFTFAPESTGINLNTSGNNKLACLTDNARDCFVMPSATGLNVNTQEVNFPEQLEADFHLVVMPFDREQQVLAVTWLPLFQDLASEYDNLQYWSIAALPELNSGIRLLVIGGISAAISAAEVRTQVTVLFLEQQEMFLEALGIDSIDEIQSFIMDSDGVLYYREIGEYSEAKGDAFRAALEKILLES